MKNLASMAVPICVRDREKAPPSNRWNDWCQNALYQALSEMPTGRLHVQCFDGSEAVFGTRQPGPEARIQIRSPAFFSRCVLSADIGFGESYVAGDWDSPDLTGVLA
ncbi:MAG: hypothetical protein EXS36_19150 [Pedosphaera sp.]|nr:hypothetical protein [Pedosphaera sp.]